MERLYKELEAYGKSDFIRFTCLGINGIRNL